MDVEDERAGRCGECRALNLESRFARDELSPAGAESHICFGVRADSFERLAEDTVDEVFQKEVFHHIMSLRDCNCPNLGV